MIKDQGIFSWVITLLILITYLLTMYGYCWEKIDLGHYWDFNGLSNWPVIVLIIKIRIVIKKFLNNCKQNILWRNSLTLLMPVRAEKRFFKKCGGIL